MSFDSAGWFVAADPHFEVYSQAGAESAKRTLTRFEQIRAFLNRSRILGFSTEDPKQEHPIRVVEFRTSQQYSAVKIDPLADAYYASLNDANYIAMPVLSGNAFRVAAHEYTHYMLHAAKLPAWLNEGLSEALSTITITAHGCEVGGEIAAHTETLRRNPWIAKTVFFQSERPGFSDSIRTSVFYAQSWAVADMLLRSPGFADKFDDFVGKVNSGESSVQAFLMVYGLSLEEVLALARQWVRHGGSQRRRFPQLEAEVVSVTVAAVGERQVLTVIADLLATDGDLTGARQIYEKLLAESPGDPVLLASMGTLALRSGERNRAVECWRAAVNAGLRDVALCYRYAQLADQMDLPVEEVKHALERVVALRPDFDEARYRLAQLASNRGEYPAALIQLQAMKSKSSQTFGYWAMLSSALMEVGRPEDAVSAAGQAQRVANDSGQFARAAQLAYFAQTEVQVQYVRDADGKLRLTTVRTPRGSTVNPFVEAQDRMKTKRGVLREIECFDNRLTAMEVTISGDSLRLVVPDPARVLIKKGSSAFTCGPQPQELSVNVEYATTDQTRVGVLRGLEVVEDATYKPVLQSPTALGFAPTPPGRIPSSTGATSSSRDRIR